MALTGLNDAGAKYENFLLVIAYWIGPWLAVVFADQVPAPRPARSSELLFDKRHTNWAGPVAMLVGMVRVDLAVLQPDRSTSASSPGNVPASATSPSRSASWWPP